MLLPLFGFNQPAALDALKAQGIEVERADLRLPEGSLKLIGDTQVQVVLHSDVVAGITVSVLGEH